MCLICGHMGCGRYVDAHAKVHHEETGHTYALEIETQRVWDYAGDGYVHRLIQNAVDGKMVELPEADSFGTSRQEGEDVKELDKSALEELMLHFEDNLQNELQKQRQYYEQELDRQAALAQRNHEELRSTERKHNTLNAEHDVVSKEVEFLREVNAQMVRNQHEWEVKLKVAEARIGKIESDKDCKIAELEALNADLLSNMQALQQMAALGQEGGRASMVVPDEPESLQAKMRRAKEKKQKASGRR